MVTGGFCPPPRCCSRDFSCCMQRSELQDRAPHGTAPLGFAELLSGAAHPLPWDRNCLVLGLAPVAGSSLLVHGPGHTCIP